MVLAVTGVGAYLSVGVLVWVLGFSRDESLHPDDGAPLLGVALIWPMLLVIGGVVVGLPALNRWCEDRLLARTTKKPERVDPPGRGPKPC